MRELIKEYSFKTNLWRGSILDGVQSVTSEISRPGLELAGFLNFYPVELYPVIRSHIETSFVAPWMMTIRLEVMERL